MNKKDLAKVKPLTWLEMDDGCKCLLLMRINRDEVGKIKLYVYCADDQSTSTYRYTHDQVVKVLSKVEVPE